MNATKTENEKPALLHKLAPGAYGSAEFIGRPFAAEYGALAGKTIQHIQLTSDGPGGFKPVIVFTDGTVAFVMCDPEGNGPGHLDIVKGGAK
jgi:hypothetical protein